MPRRLPELDADARKAAAKSADSRSSNFADVEWDNNTVSKFFLIMFSVLTDVAPGHVACFLWVNSLTSRVPFASVTGATRFLNIDAESHCMTAEPRVQSFFDRPGFGSPDENWEDLSGLITNFSDFMEITTRVMHGLLGYDGRVYDAIKTLDPFACIESCSVICELFHHVSAASVSKNWSLFNSFEYTLGSDMRDFTRRLLELRNKLDADGQCLERKRPGPLAIDALQTAIDAIRATGTSDFDIAVSKGQALLDGPSVSMAQLVKYFKVLHLASADKFPIASPLSAAVFPARCTVCGGSGHTAEQCPSPRTATPGADDGTSRPMRGVDREYKKRGTSTDE